MPCLPAQGTLTYASNLSSNGEISIVVNIDLGYPTTSLLASGATLLAIAYEDTGVLAPNCRQGCSAQRLGVRLCLL